jgi:hypothetical protein
MTIATSPDVDTAVTQAFMGRVLGDTSASMVTAMAALGDRLGLFKVLATRGPATADEVATRTGTQPRYAREWLGGMAAAGYITYEPATGEFSLPAEHAAVLADEGGPYFVGAAFQLTMPKLQLFDRVAEVFISGGGITESEYAEGLWAGQARFSAGWVEHLLTQVWVPSIAGLDATLRRGGCGPCSVSAPGCRTRLAVAVRRDHHLRRGPRCSGSTRTPALYSSSPETRRGLRVPRDQLRGPTRRQCRPVWCAVSCHQRVLLHDHLAGSWRGGPGHARAAGVQTP